MKDSSKLLSTIAKEYLKEQYSTVDEDLWHGSPYDFDEFLLDYMGTGEGDQAFGWGLYLTDLEDIADAYAIERDGSIPTKYYVKFKNNKSFDDFKWLEWDEDISLEQKEFLYKNTSKKNWKGIIHNIEVVDKFDADTYDEGGVKVHKVGDATKFGRDDEFIKKSFNSLKDAEEEASRLNFLHTDMDGKDLYESLGDKMGYKKASLFLLKNGYAGIKFSAEDVIKIKNLIPDREGFNYVIFDPSILKIERKVRKNKLK